MELLFNNTVYYTIITLHVGALDYNYFEISYFPTERKERTNLKLTNKLICSRILYRYF